MSNHFSWEENNRRYAEDMAALEVKGDGKCYFPCNDFRGLRMRRILGTTNEKHCKDKGHAEVGYEYHPLVRCYSLHIVFLVILLIVCIHNFFYHFKYMCCILYTNVIALFVNINTMPPRS